MRRRLRLLLLVGLVLLGGSGIALADHFCGEFGCSSVGHVYLPAVHFDEPPPPPPPTPTPAPPAPTTVYVKSSSSYTTSTYRYVVGEVVNNTKAVVCGVRVTVRFYGGGNTLVAVEDGYAVLSKTEVGQANPFLVLLSNAPTSIARYELHLNWRTCQYDLQYRNITVLSDAVRDNYGIEIFGELRNDHPQTVRGVEVAVTFYDEAGTVVDVDWGYASSGADVPAGATTTYKVTTLSKIAYARYTVQAQGYFPP